MRAYAKINLSLEVLGKRPDGFHSIRSIMQQIDLYDELTFELADTVHVESSLSDEIMLKTIHTLQSLFRLGKGVKIMVKKKIPVAAGLGGGSSDAAITLLALNRLWSLNLGSADLMKIAAEIGSDVPFFIQGGCCLVSGRGEQVKKIKGEKMDILLVNPGYEISTTKAYELLDKEKRISRSSGIKSPHNDFLCIQKQDVHDIIDEMKDLGAVDASITGKGPTVFGIFDKNIKKAHQKIKNKYPFVRMTKTITQ